VEHLAGARPRLCDPIRDRIARYQGVGEMFHGRGVIAPGAA